MMTDEIARDICSLVLAYDSQEQLEEKDNTITELQNLINNKKISKAKHTKDLELEAEVLKKQQMLIDSEKRCSLLEKNLIALQVKFQDQTHDKDKTIKELKKQIYNTKVPKAESTNLEMEITQLKEKLASVHIQLSDYKKENKTLSQQYEELAKSNMASRAQLTGKITVLTSENATLKARVKGKEHSGSKSPEKPKVTTTGMVSASTKYIPPPRRPNRVAPTPYPKQKQATLQGTPRQSPRPTPTRVVQQQRKHNVPTSHSPRRVDQKRKLTNQNRVASDWSIYRTCFNFQPSPGCPTRNKRLSSGNSDSYVVQNWKPINHKTTPIKQDFRPVKQIMKPVMQVWKATGKVFASVGFQWKPTGRKFTLDEMCPLNRSPSYEVMPVEPSKSISPSTPITMISRFSEEPLSSYKASSKGISSIFAN